MIKFTVFTGTYNSEGIIDRVFQSVLEQTNKDFEWIVIDDCSKDNTVALIEEFMERNPQISIKLVRHETNTGVATSRMEAIHLARGKYFVSWDHDDIQDKDQLEIFNKLWGEYDEEDIGNIFAKMNNQKGEILGQFFPMNPFVSDYISMHNK